MFQYMHGSLYYSNYISQAIVRAVDIVLCYRFGHKGLVQMLSCHTKKYGGDT